MVNWSFNTNGEHSIYESLCLRTTRKDWFEIIKHIGTLASGKSILDVGCGNGHTTKQILDRLAFDVACAIMDPNQAQLREAERLISIENTFAGSYTDVNMAGRADNVFAIHSNYYFADSWKEYKKKIVQLRDLARKEVYILTLPKESDHYNISVERAYPEFVYSDCLLDQFSNASVKRFKMRIFVEDLLDNVGFYELDNFYKFIHNTLEIPSRNKREQFLERINAFGKDGYLDFKDELIVVTK